VTFFLVRDKDRLFCFRIRDGEEEALRCPEITLKDRRKEGCGTSVSILNADIGNLKLFEHLKSFSEQRTVSSSPSLRLASSRSREDVSSLPQSETGEGV
jgi:hypothetical protein